MFHPKVDTQYDLIIIGSGPAGLAALSCVQEDYSLDILDSTQVQRASSWIKNGNRAKKRVMVIDPNENWLDEWERNFDTLDIQFLRSPTMAHCSYFDRNALLCYAISHGREEELLDTGCSDIKSLRGTVLTSVGLWKLPSSKLFLDFSRDLAKTLPHDYICGKVVDIHQMENDEFRVVVDDVSQNEAANDEKQMQLHQLTTSSIIVATGTVGRPIVPKPLQTLSGNENIFQWKDLNRVIDIHSKRVDSRILVVGGGLTAVQSAQKLVRKTTASVTLMSRKPLVERHFDIPTKWFDQREAHIHQAQFYHEPIEERLIKLKTTRGGGTVPPLYMNEIREMILKGELDVQCGTIAAVKEREQGGSLLVTIQFNKGTDQCDLKYEEHEFDSIVLACGTNPDILASPLFKSTLKKWPMDIVGGYPVVSEDLRITKNLHVIGGLASLAVGPDAANLMGISRAAEMVANALKTKEWLREMKSNVLRNPYDVFLETDISSDEETETD